MTSSAVQQLTDTNFSFIGYLIGLAVVAVVVVLPILAMGLRSKFILARRSHNNPLSS